MDEKAKKEIYLFGNFRLDASRKLLFRLPQEEKIPLTHKAFKVLLLLIQNNGKLVTKDEMMSEVWEGSFVEEANLTQTISVLRKKLGENPNQHRFIVTETGKGYRFVAPVEKPIKDKLEDYIDEPSLNQATKEKSETTKKDNKKRFFLALTFSILFVVLTVFTYYFFFNQEIEGLDWTKAQNVRLTSQSGEEFFPSFNPNTESFVYAGLVKGNFDIFLKRIGGKKSINLTENSNLDDTQPSYSPDGKFIAFRSERNGGGIFIMEETGENPRRVSDFGFHPSWSPDGKKIAFSERGYIRPQYRLESALWVVDVETGEKQKIIGDFAYQPVWSPNGKRLAFWFIDKKNNRRSIATVSSEGGELKVVSNEDSTAFNPVWSPDGKFLYFAGDRSGNMAFWRVAINQSTGEVLGKTEIVPTPAKFNSHLSFSKDGKRLIYAQTETKSNLKGVEFDSDKLKVVGEPYSILKGDYEIRRPRLSPDDKYFVFEIAKQTQEDIALVDIEGKNWSDLTNDEFFERYPVWSSDGKTIAFISVRKGKREVRTINFDGSDSRKIISTEKPIQFLTWSPNEKKLAFSKGGEHYILDFQNSNESKQTKLPEVKQLEYFDWDWSPDGKKIAGKWKETKANKEGIGYFSLSEGKYEKVWEGTANMPKWMPDSKNLLFSLEGKLQIININKREMEEVLNISPEKIIDAGISRNGKLLYFTARTTESNIWMLDLKKE